MRGLTSRFSAEDLDPSDKRFVAKAPPYPYCSTAPTMTRFNSMLYRGPRNEYYVCYASGRNSLLPSVQDQNCVGTEKCSTPLGVPNGEVVD